MKIAFLIICFAAFAHSCFSQAGVADTLPGAVSPGSDSNLVICKVEPEAEFPGSDQGWVKFLQKNLNAERIKKALRLPGGAPAWKQTATFLFIVNRNGTISDLRIVNEVHPLVRQEVLRVMRLSPRWKPATQGGRAVKAYRQQSITFIIEPE